MYFKHPDLPSIDKAQKIWHYFTLPKFISLISNSSLYFCRQDKFDDSFEGALTEKDEVFIEKISQAITKNMKGGSLGCTYSNCWTKSEADEYVLWSSYASLTDGIAIQSTVAKLIYSLDPDDKRQIYMSDVQYIDYKRNYSFQLTGGKVNLIAPHFTKRPYFDAEKEFRALYWDKSGRYCTSSEGLLFKVNLNELIENVYVVPFSKPWYKALIEDLIDKYGIKKEVRHSSI